MHAAEHSAGREQGASNPSEAAAEPDNLSSGGVGAAHRNALV